MLIQFIILIRSFEYPIGSLFTIDQACSNEQVTKMQEYMDERTKICLEDPYAEDCGTYGVYEIKASNGENMNDFIANTSEKSQQVILTFYNYNGELDLNYLKNKKTVKIIIVEDQGTCSFFDDSEDNLMILDKKIRSNSFTQNNSKKIKESKIQLVGDIREKVPFLLLYQGNFEIVKSDLICDNVYIFKTTIEKSNYKIKSFFFLKDYDGDFFSPKYHTSISTDMFKVKEFDEIFYCLYFDEVRINCYNNYITISNKTENGYEDLGMTFPYEIMGKCGVIFEPNIIDIYNAETHRSNAKNINISILKEMYIIMLEKYIRDRELEGKPIYMSDEKKIIYIKATGWGNTDFKPKIEITYDFDHYIIDKSLASDLFIEEKSFKDVKIVYDDDDDDENNNDITYTDDSNNDNINTYDSNNNGDIINTNDGDNDDFNSIIITNDNNDIISNDNENNNNNENNENKSKKNLNLGMIIAFAIIGVILIIIVIVVIIYFNKYKKVSNE